MELVLLFIWKSYKLLKTHEVISEFDDTLNILNFMHCERVCVRVISHAKSKNI